MFIEGDNFLVMVKNSIDNLVNFILRRTFANYRENMVRKIWGSEVIFDYVDKHYYRYHKTTLNRAEIYIDSLKMLQDKEAMNTKIKERE